MKAVLFDFGGTLDSDGLAWGDRFFPLYKEALPSLRREQFDAAFWESDDCLPQRFSLGGLSLEETLHRQVRCVLERLAPGRAALESQLAGRFLAGCRGVFARNQPMLERLKSRYKLGIVSNFYGNLCGVLESEGLAGYFDVVADSAVVGHIKPSKEIFLYAANALGTEPADCLMVGDSIGRDMRGAEGLGMRHAFLTPNPSADICCPSVWRLASLVDLERRLS